MHTIQNTLYITTPNAYAHLENDTLRIDVDHEKKLAVPLHHLGSVVCFGNIMVSPALMHRLASGKGWVVCAGSTACGSGPVTIGAGGGASVPVAGLVTTLAGL